MFLIGFMLPSKNKCEFMVEPYVPSSTVRYSLQAWVDREISTDEAVRLTDSGSFIELYNLAVSYDVDLVKIQRVAGETDEEFVARFLQFHEELAHILTATAKSD
ncbi:hypothetical protein RHIZ404_90026 [Rhizobium sp. EC-SD404]|nr:hypothetical protein RHIZ404_90026 [Rhizobium sp. EC-SD404]